MPSLGAFLRGAKFKKLRSETTLSPADLPFEKLQISLFPPQIGIQRSYSSGSLNLFRKKNKQSIDIIRVSDDIDVKPSSEANRNAEQNLNSQSISATNGLAALRINTPNSFLPSADTTRPSDMSRDAISDERASNVTPQSQTSIFSATPPLSTPESQSPHIPESKPSFLTLPASDPSFETFNVSIDFAKFEETKVEAQPPYKPIPPRLITHHDFLFLVDDGQGIDHRAWNTICDLVSSVSKQLIPIAGRDSIQLQNIPSDSPTISIRFVNNPRNIPRVQNIAQIRNIFNWVTPREVPKYHHRYPSQKPQPAVNPPLRTLEYHFWNVYNEKLQKNAWVGQTPTTIILFTSSPLSNRPEDMDLFVAKCAELLNADQVPLPLVSIMVVQCNSDLILHRQLVDTRRVINLEWYTPRPKPTQPSTIGRKPVAKGSIFSSSQNPQLKRRPRRDWVDIVTCVDWERAGGISAIKEIIEDEIYRGIQRRKKLQKEAAMNYLTHLGKENTSQIQEGNKTKVDNSNYIPGCKRGQSWSGEDEFHGKIGRESDNHQQNHQYQHHYKQHHHHHQRGGGAIHTGQIDYYD